MPVAGAVSVIVVVVCLCVVQLHHGLVVDAGGPSTAVSARQSLSVSKPRLTDDHHWNRIALMVPDRSKSKHAAVHSGKRKRYRDGRRATRRRAARKSLKAVSRRRHKSSQVDINVDEMERQLRQYQQRRIAAEIARLRAMHKNPGGSTTRHSAAKHRTTGGRRRRRLRASRMIKTTFVDSPKINSQSL